jgi:hypothetical protein
VAAHDLSMPFEGCSITYQSQQSDRRGFGVFDVLALSDSKHLQGFVLSIAPAIIQVLYTVA